MNIVYIRGNLSYGTLEMHKQLENTIKKIVQQNGFDFVTMNSDKADNKIPNGVLYIGFSRGTRYFKKIHKIKIGIGSNKGTYSFINKDDKASEGNISKESLQSHFVISKTNLYKLNDILKNLRT